MPESSRAQSASSAVAEEDSLLLEMGVETQPVEVELFSDSTGVISAQSRLGLGKHMKHVEVRHLFLQELVRNKRLRITKIHTSRNQSDVLTKYVSAETLKKHVEEIGLKISGKKEVAAMSAARRDTGAAAEVLRGIRLCLVGLTSLVPEAEAAKEIMTAVSTEVERKIADTSSIRMKAAWLMVVLCGGLALWCWARMSGGGLMKNKATQTDAKSRQEWMEMTIETLRSKCSERGLGTSGTKEALSERLMKAREKEEALSALHGV